MNNDILQMSDIIQSYLPEEKSLELFIKLDEEIGKKTQNTTIKSILQELRKTVDKPLPPPPLWLKAIFYLLIIVHIAMVIAVFFAFFILPFYTPWYISIPLMTFIFFFSTTRVECQLTNLENGIRKRLGRKKIGGFVGHYFIKPAKIVIGLKKRKT